MGLDSEHFNRYRQLLLGELEVSALSDAEAGLFAAALAQAEEAAGAAPRIPAAARTYLARKLDEMDKGLEPTALLPEFIKTNTHNRPSSKKANIPNDWKSLTQVREENIGSYHCIKALVLTEYEGAPARNNCVRQIKSGQTFVSPEYTKWLSEQGILRPKALAAPYVTDNTWQSANMLQENNAGSSQTINNKLAAF